jgi:hypothetical protein
MLALNPRSAALGPNVLLLGLLAAGCVGSSVQMVDLEIPKRAEQTLSLTSFRSPEKVLVAQDWRNGNYQHVDTGYTETRFVGLYGFDAEDFQNLRKSLVQSLAAAQGFKKVEDSEAIAPGSPPSGQWRLNVAFKLAGMKQTAFASTCYLVASCALEGPDGKTIRDLPVNIEERSLLTVSAAKNDAIEAFVEACAKSLEP